MALAVLLTALTLAACAPRTQTRLAIVDGKWRINGETTYQGSQAAGLLMNVRMVNSTFEDRAIRADLDAEANTDRFISRIPDYASAGVRAFTLNLQGGMPGYEGALNSAFMPDGSLRPSYLARIARVIRACDQAGLGIILGCFYQRQDQVLQDGAAVRAGVVNTARWIDHMGFTNVVLEIANEYRHRGFDHDLIRTPEGMAELIRLAKATNPDLLVSASGLGGGKIDSLVAEASDFILIHFNSTPVEEIPGRIQALKPYCKPIVCNEDDKVGEKAAQALRASVENGCSWGYMHNDLNQYVPFEFNGIDDDPPVYTALGELTVPR